MLYRISALAVAFVALAACPLSAPRAAIESAEQMTRSALEFDADPKRGASLYAKNCASCHGTRAFGDPNRGVPALAAQRRAYIIKQMADFTERDRITTQMHKVVQREAVAGIAAWADLALYLNQLQAPTSMQTGDGKYLSLGEASYAQWCASCHEEDARGDDDGFVPSLRNQHYGYLLKEARGLAAGHRFNVEPELSRFLASLESDEMTGLADYLSRMHGPVRDRTRLRDDGTSSD